MTLFKILGLLAIALVVIIPLLERYAPQPGEAKVRRISRWILPLCASLILLQLLLHWFA